MDIQTFYNASKNGDFLKVQKIYNACKNYFPSEVLHDVLLIAIEYNYEDIVDFLLINVTKFSHSEWKTAFSRAVERQRHKIFFELEKMAPSSINKEDLYYPAMENRDYLLLTHLFNKKHCDINDPNILEIASQISDVNLMEFLLTSSALDMHATLQNNVEDILQNLVKSGNVQSLKYFCEHHKIHIKSKFLNYDIPNVEMFKFLWNHPDLENDCQKNKYLKYIFRGVIYRDNFDLGVFLLEDPAVSSLFTPNLNKALCTVVSHSNYHMLHYLLSSPHLKGCFDIHHNDNALFGENYHMFLGVCDNTDKTLALLLDHATSYVNIDHLFTIEKACGEHNNLLIIPMLKYLCKYNPVEFLMQLPHVKKYCQDNAADDIIDIIETLSINNNLSISTEDFSLFN